MELNCLSQLVVTVKVVFGFSIITTTGEDDSEGKEVEVERIELSQ